MFWSCAQCGGRAVAIPVIRSALGDDRVTALWSRAITAPDNTGKACPICSRRMTDVTIGFGRQMLDLDVCKRCEFVWFDATEYESIPPAPPKPDESGRVDDKDLPQAAREALALYKVQKIAEDARAEEDEMPDEGWKTIPAIFGLPVEMDSDPLKRVPWATLLTALSIAVVSFWGFFDLDNVVREFGLIPDEAWRYGGLTFLTSFFLHGGAIHLIGNLYFLIIFGEHVEDYLGRKRWLLLLFLAAITGDTLHVAFDPRGTIPCIGASGGIAGLIAFYAFKFPHAKLGILFRYFVYFRWLKFPAWSAFLMWLLLQFLGAYEQVAGFSNVSSLAHLGGSAIGVALWFWWRKIELKPATAEAESPVDVAV